MNKRKKKKKLKNFILKQLQKGEITAEFQKLQNGEIEKIVKDNINILTDVLLNDNVQKQNQDHFILNLFNTK